MPLSSAEHFDQLIGKVQAELKPVNQLDGRFLGPWVIDVNALFATPLLSVSRSISKSSGAKGWDWKL